MKLQTVQQDRIDIHRHEVLLQNPLLSVTMITTLEEFH